MLNELINFLKEKYITQEKLNEIINIYKKKSENLNIPNFHGFLFYLYENEYFIKIGSFQNNELIKFNLKENNDKLFIYSSGFLHDIIINKILNNNKLPFFIKYFDFDYSDKNSILVMEYVPLSFHTYLMNNVNKETLDILLIQIIFLIHILQKKYKFMHLDMSVKNILLEKTNKKYIKFKINEKFYKIPTFGFIIKLIDFSTSQIHKLNKKPIIIKNIIYEQNKYNNIEKRKVSLKHYLYYLKDNSIYDDKIDLFLLMFYSNIYPKMKQSILYNEYDKIMKGISYNNYQRSISPSVFINQSDYVKKYLMEKND